MNRALAAIFAVVITPFGSAASAQTRFEEAAEDVKCEWTDKEGRHGSDICHITSQGTAQGETAMSFRIGNRKFEYVVSDGGWARLIKGEKTIWEGKTVQFDSKGSLTVIKISDGMTVWFRYK